jgi:acyl-CoA thioesterase FadM
MKIDYLAPTPIDAELELRAMVRERSGRKRVVECTVSAAGKVCARGEVVAIEVPPSWLDAGPVTSPAAP